MFSLLMKASSSGEEDLTFLTRSDTTVYVPHKVSGKQREDAGSLPIQGRRANQNSKNHVFTPQRYRQSGLHTSYSADTVALGGLNFHCGALSCTLSRVSM